ncbi:MAG: 4Fe-4S binding protein [Thermofilum sp.]|jgi:formate hydrogenlyase subunit 6/NADH:ubiquinone oxidoreductase subunit I|nr:4Fe-4S binding protein [Thermofilum sp.]MCC6064829.1 4Fe-4S binding protein [Thermofilum sp.]
MALVFDVITNLFRKRATVLYPEERKEEPGTFRGVLGFERSLCIGCGLCWRVCPASAIEASRDEKGARPVFHLDRCIYCYLCVEVCPRKAIKASSRRAPAVEDKRKLEVG